MPKETIMRIPLPFALLLLAFWSTSAEAAVGLTTVPERDTVRMTIYNAVDLTLVQESRVLVLKKGINRIQYQWAGTLIDTTSLELRALEKQADTEIIDIVYPPNSPATLVWQVESKIEGPVRFEISYFTSGLTWGADYVLRASPDEATADLEGWVAVGNQSGEDYPKAEVRLVVGTINLVERIRDLATGQESERVRPLARNEVAKNRDAMGGREAAFAAPAAAMPMEQRAEVVSARLADYHIFSIGGVQEVKNGATTRFLAIQNQKPMAIEVLYRVPFRQEQALKLYRFINDAEHQLPDGPLPDGAWHVFRVTDAVTRALGFSGTATCAYVPPGQKVELGLGNDPGIAVKQVHEQHAETDQHYDRNGRLDGFIEHDRWRFKLVNTKPIAVSLEYLVAAGGDWAVTGLDGERRDQNTFRHQDRVEAGKALELGPFTITTRKGARSASGGVAPAPPKPPEVVPLPRVQTERK
jgi:hypothetical protein